MFGKKLPLDDTATGFLLGKVMNQSMFELIPVVEIQYHSLPFEWVPSETDEAFIELNDLSSDADVARIVALLVSYNEILSSGSIDEAAHAILDADHLVLPGGLMVRSENIEVPPSCCCGLEDWREWFDVILTGTGPWLGHDPSPWVECKPDFAIVWADDDLGDQSPNVVVSYSDLDVALHSAKADLLAFTVRLSDWLSRHTGLGPDVSQHFSKEFHISQNN